MLPSADAEPERYRGRPLLVILENYVLAAIGELPSDKHSAVGQVVQRVYGGGADWMQTVRQQLQLDDGLDENLRQMWTRNKEMAKQKRVPLHPIQFAKMVADQNFAHLIKSR